MKKRTNNYYNSSEKILEEITKFENVNKIKFPEDWYTIELKGLVKTYNYSITTLFYKKFGGSSFKIAKYKYPNFDWKEWKFLVSPKNFWDCKKNQIKYLKWLEKKLGYTKAEDWYSIRKSDLTNNNGRSLFRRENLLSNIPKILYPTFNWEEWKFKQIHCKFWNKQENQKKYLKWLEKKLHVNKPEDWYRVSSLDIQNNYGKTLFDRFNRSIIEVCRFVYPEFNWLEWKFNTCPRHFWSDKNNQIKYLKWLENKLEYTQIEDWYDIISKHFSKNYGQRLLIIYNNSPIKICKFMYPEFKWEKHKFSKNRTQKHLFKIIKKLYPTKNIEYNYKHPDIRFSKSNRCMESDIYISELSLSLEYQGEFHTRAWGGKVAELRYVQRLDKEKRISFKKAGIKNIDIWWNEWDLSENYIIDKLSQEGFSV